MRFLIVGGGPVGLFAATAAGLRGHDVTVLERRAADGDKACGEGLMPSAVDALRSIGVMPDGCPISGIRYLDGSGRYQVRADLRAGPGLGVRRTTLVAALRTRAQEVGVDLQHATATDVHDEGPVVTVNDSAGGEWWGDVLLGCDGPASVVRHVVGLDASVSAVARYGLVAHFAVAPWSSDVEVHWSRSGEAYVTPVAPDMVGVALLGGQGLPFDDRLTEFEALRDRLGGAAAVGKVLGAGPMRRRASAPVRGRVALVGDAAGYVDALTGEGLSVGFASARAAVTAAEEGRLAAYRDEWRTITRVPTRLTEGLLWSSQRATVRRALVPAAVQLSPVFGRLVGVLS